MWYLVNVDHNGMAAHFTRIDCEGSNAVYQTDDNMFWNDSEEDSMLVVSVRKMRALNVDGDSATDQ
jgi:hypothetical protein